MTRAQTAAWHSIAGLSGRLRNARLDALIATWLVPPALAVAFEVTLPTYAELTPVALTSAVLHTPLTVARLVLRQAATGIWFQPPKCSATSFPLIPSCGECRSGADTAARQCSA